MHPPLRLSWTFWLLAIRENVGGHCVENHFGTSGSDSSQSRLIERESHIRCRNGPHSVFRIFEDTAREPDASAGRSRYPNASSRVSARKHQAVRWGLDKAALDRRHGCSGRNGPRCCLLARLGYLLDVAFISSSPPDLTRSAGTFPFYTSSSLWIIQKRSSSRVCQLVNKP